MNEMFQSVWEFVKPWVIYGAASFFMVFAPWALDAIRATEWYKGLPFWMRKLIDFAGAQALRVILPKVLLAKTVYQTDLKIAVQNEVDALMPEADRLKGTYGGNLPTRDAALLKDAAVQSALQVTMIENPEIKKAIAPREMESIIAGHVAPAVEKAKKKRRPHSVAASNHRRGK